MADVYIIGDDIDKIENELDQRSGFKNKLLLGDDSKPMEPIENEDTKAIDIVDNENKI